MDFLTSLTEHILLSVGSIILAVGIFWGLLWALSYTLAGLVLSARLGGRAVGRWLRRFPAGNRGSHENRF